MIGLAGVEIPEGYIDLGAHAPGENGTCTLCGSDINTETYEEYTTWWYANEWEGERFHTPMDEVTWRYIRVSCLANDPAQAEAEIAHEREQEEAQAAHDRMIAEEDAVDEWERESEADIMRRYPGVL